MNVSVITTLRMSEIATQVTRDYKVCRLAFHTINNVILRVVLLYCFSVASIKYRVFACRSWTLGALLLLVASVKWAVISGYILSLSQRSLLWGDRDSI